MSRYGGGGGSGGGGGRSRRDSGLDSKVYVGDLPKDASDKDIERAFSYYGTIRNVWVARNPPGFAFVEFEDQRDADDAVRGLDGSNVCGVRVRVEMSSGKVRQKPWQRGPPRGGGRDFGGRRNFNPDDRCYECGKPGHYAYDCRNRGRSGGRGGGGRSGGSRRSRSRSNDRSRRSYSRSRSRSRGRDRSVSRSPRRYSRSRSRSPAGAD